MAIDHDLRLVVLAALFCLTASLTAFRLHGRSLEGGEGARVAWLLLTGLAAGSGVWATHFIAMLAYAPVLAVSYEPAGTFLSFVIAVATTACAFGLAAPASRWRQLAAGAVFGLGVAAMHYSGMSAFHTKALLLWDAPTVAVSIGVGVLLSAAAMAACGDCRSWRRRVLAGGLLTLGICALHFTGMSAVTMLPDPAAVLPDGGFSRAAMVVGVAGLTGVVLAGTGALLAVDLHNRRARTHQMELMFEANPMPMWLVDTGTLAILGVNQAAVVEYGYSREQFAAMTAFDVIHPDERSALEAFLASGQVAYQAERAWRHVKADGSEILVLPRSRPIEVAGRTAMLAALVDVTLREKAAAALVEAKEAAEAANRAKDEFLANMSHEIRTPLNGVVGILGALERTPLSEAQREMTRIIGSSASTLQRLLNDLLEISRIEAGEGAIEHRAFNLRALVHETAELHAQAARDKNVSFVCTPGSEEWVEGDPDRTRQILGNLLSNAVKFTDTGVVRLEVERSGDRVRFTVSDTGVGFDEAFQQRLFGRFEQADSTITRRFGGSGLGLAIAQGLAVRMGGSLTASSQPGQGSQFRFEAPFPACAAPAPEPAPAAPATEGAMRVLLADDHPVNRKVVRMMLAAADVELVEVENGAQAVEAYAPGRFDLVLMDMQMPVMDGLEATRRLRALDAELPIFVLSANALPSHVEAARAAGATTHLSKPITIAALLGALGSVRPSARLAA